MKRHLGNMSLFDSRQSDQYAWWKTFLINISLILILYFLAIFIGIIVRNNNLINNEIIARARSHFKSIVLARRWNANYGGVFIEKKEGIESNPYLEDPDIETKDGVIYTMKNPALMTREISEYAFALAIKLFADLLIMLPAARYFFLFLLDRAIDRVKPLCCFEKQPLTSFDLQLGDLFFEFGQGVLDNEA